ncbi:MAG: GNAT family N-acetyltransferase [Gammaproteobacteria bacterium]|nr:GNAT family N-acetyltransferase [Gammaproteobacteria bacterium]
MDTNSLGQPIGCSVGDWSAPTAHPATMVLGSYVRLVRLDSEHASDLFKAFSAEQSGEEWTYLPYGPFETQSQFENWLLPLCRSEDPFMYSILDSHTGVALGVASYLRINPSSGSVEVGHIHFSKQLQRTRKATEAMYLLAQQAFDLGYRRYEWKCDSLNSASRRAAKRLGFTFEGVFRQATVYKNRNRDTAWFSILDHEWPILEKAFQRWLSNENFSTDGRQVKRLVDCFALHPSAPS